MTKLKKTNWPFYVTGPLLALWIVLALSCFNDNIGLSEDLTAVGEYCDEAVANREIPQSLPEMIWSHLLLAGVIAGAALAAVAGRSFRLETTGSDGSGLVSAATAALRGAAGGFLVMLGIQLAGESVWGETAAAIQLAPGGWLFWLGLALGGATPAILLAHRSGAKPGTSKSEKEA